jgi:hypothetical protein
MTGIIEATGLPRNASTFSLCRSANVDKLRLIQSQGVKAINLDVSLFDATLDNIDRTTVRQQIGGILMDQVKAMIFKDKTPEEIANAENLTARVILTYDSRKKGMSLGREGVEQLAIQMLDDDDEGFSIRTAGGQRIKGSDISLTKIVKIQKHGKSVFCSDAWRELETYYYELRADGLLEQ